MKKIIVGAFAGWLSLWHVVFAAVPEYTAMKAGCPMVMDGFLDEPAWKQAHSVGPFQFPWYQSGEKEPTEAKIVWDDKRIYFAFQCADQHISAEQYSPNSPVSRDDCCEAFISPVAEGSERLDYINYEINCIGTWLVGYHASPEMPTGESGSRGNRHRAVYQGHGEQGRGHRRGMGAGILHSLDAFQGIRGQVPSEERPGHPCRPASLRRQDQRPIQPVGALPDRAA